MGAARSSKPDPLIGATIADRYRIVSLIARGGMGKVYRAEQSALGRICALKLLVPDDRAEQDPEFFRRFSREAATAAKLTHPNSVTVFDYGKDEALGIYFIAMEYIAGRTLHCVVQEDGPLPETRVNRIAQQICRSLAEAHGLGLVHRDLKPSNVILVDRGDERDYVKVLDFGLVKDISGQQDDLTQKGLFMGSPKYTAPEQVLGTELSSRADIYSLGVVLYEMLCGVPPFDKKVNTATLMAHVNEPPAPLAHHAAGVFVSPAMDAIVMRCLEKSPDDRFETMKECLTALKLAAGEPLDSGNPSLSSIPGRSSMPSQPGLVSPPAPSGSGLRQAVVVAPPMYDSVSMPERPRLNDSLAPPQATPTFNVPVVPRRNRLLPTSAIALVAAVVGGAAVLALGGRMGQQDQPETPRVVEPVIVPIAVPASSFSGVESNTVAGFRIVRIESEPPGARVSDRGTEVCLSTPCRLVLQGAGITAEYQLQLTKPGYKAVTLVVHPDDETASAQLDLLYGVALAAAPAAPNASASAQSAAVPAAVELPEPTSVETTAPPPTVAAAAAPPAAAPSVTPAAAAPGIMHFQDGMTRPVALSAPAIRYTREARLARIEGTVIAKCVVTTTGTLSDCRIVKGLPHMNEAVLSALAASRYKPITYQGRPVNVDYVFPIKLVPP